MNEDNKMIQVCSTSIILLIFMSDTFFLYKSNEGCFTFCMDFCMDCCTSKTHRSAMKRYSY